MRTASRSARGVLSRGALLLVAFAAACVLVPGLFWWGTTFTRSLDDSQLVEHLRPDASAREAQHAVEELSRRFVEGRPGMDRWAEDLVRVSRRPEEAVRISAAWCMQFDATRAAFRARLREMVEDASPMVRRNAATSLARAGDPAALPELRVMLQPFPVTSPAAGTLEDVAAVERPVHQGAVVARVLPGGDGGAVDVVTPVPGTVAEVVAGDGDTVTAGARVVLVRPAADHVANALVALALVGERGDRALIRSFADARSGYPDDVRASADWALRELDARLGGE